MLILLCLLGCTDPAPVDTAPTQWTPPAATEGGRYIAFQTTLGTIQMELYLEEAPISTANVLAYVNEGFYDGSDGGGATILHRVEPGFVIQGGGELQDGTRKPTHPPVVNEALSSGLLNLRGTVALARQADADSATSQWFVNLKDNPGLDPGIYNPDGYSVFGVVTEGMDVVDTIAAMPTDGSRPLQDIFIESAATVPL